MSEDFQTTAPAVQQTPADQATSAAIDAVVTHKSPAQTEQLFNRATVEHRRSAPPDQDGAIGIGAARGNEAAPSMSAMPAAPAVTSESNAAVEKLTAMGGDHADLVSSWGSDAATNIEYARASFRELVASDPGLIEAADRAGIGSRPAILQHLARFGRLNAGMMGDNTVANRARSSPSRLPSPSSPRGNPSLGGSETQSELDALYAANPVGSASYRDPRVQSRIQHLHEMLSGGGSPVGIAGRRA